MLAELHCHTNYSKGTKILREGLDSPERMIKRAKKLGLDAIAITDHNEIKGAIKAKKLAKKHDIIVIPGEEIGTWHGHVLALGIQEKIEKKLSLDETLDLIHEQGGLAVSSHPFDIQRKGLGKLAKKCDAIEAFNAINVERIANWNSMKFAKKNRLPITAGSDAHCVEMLGYGVTDIYADNENEILKTIKKGRTSLIRDYMPANVIMNWYVIRLKSSYSYVVNYMNQNYAWPKRTVCKKLLSLVEKSPGNIDYLFRVLAYLSFLSVVSYSVSRQILGIR